jgi:hypothetical protein
VGDDYPNGFGEPGGRFENVTPSSPRSQLDCAIQRSRIVAMAAMGMVQLTGEKVVSVVPVRHSFVATLGAVVVVCRDH